MTWLVASCLIFKTIWKQINMWRNSCWYKKYFMSSASTHDVKLEILDVIMPINKIIINNIIIIIYNIFTLQHTVLEWKRRNGNLNLLQKHFLHWRKQILLLLASTSTTPRTTTLLALSDLRLLVVGMRYLNWWGACCYLLEDKRNTGANGGSTT